MKGQISLDFILTVSIALLVVSGLIVFGNDVAEMQTKIGIRQQLESVGTGLASVASYSAVLNDADSGDATITYSIPKILVLGEKERQPCKIEINGEYLELSYDFVNLETGIIEPITVNVPFVNPYGMTLNPALDSANQGTCGNPITITRT